MTILIIIGIIAIILLILILSILLSDDGYAKLIKKPVDGEGEDKK